MIVLNFGGNSQQDEGKLKVVASFYPLAYFTQEIGGDKVEVSSLIPYNSEVHSWQPSIGDIGKAEDADVIIYNGAGLDHWVEDDLLGSISTKDKVIVKASEGMMLLASDGQGEEDHDGGDPHLWISPYTAVRLAERVVEALMEADPDNSAYYEERWLALEQRFTDMDTRYSTELAAYSGETFFTTHAAYGYVADRYGLKQRGVIGLSADEQPSTEALAGIVEKMIEEGSHTIYIDPIYSDAYAKTLKTEIEAKTGESVMILRLYLMLGPVDGLDYFQQLESNLENLKLGLGG
jgi:zinc transport system substrate-binding protein